MGSTALVSLNIEDGQKVIDALDEAGKPPRVALWAKLPDYENWRLILASELLEQGSQFTIYSEINEAMDRAGLPLHRQPTIFLRPMHNPMIEALRQTFASVADVYGMRLGGQRFGDKFIEEGFVYRIR